MGLSSSQARLLNLTARMHDIEYKAQNLEAQKLQMANESTQVYQEYENALNKQKVQFKKISTDGSANYENASIDTLIKAGYKIRILNEDTDTVFNASAGGNLGNWEVTASEISGTIDPTSPNIGDVVKNNNEYYKISEVPTTGKNYKGYKFIKTTDTKLQNINTTNIETLSNMVEAGFIVFEKPTNEVDENGNRIYSEVNIATDTNLQEVSDETELKKAEAKYEADMRKIDAKDKKFDTDLAAMESERNAIKTEMDTLKSVAKDNVDRTFKLFS